ncbi:hypothetical protein ACOMHN_044275 [Nucella lapillus]
MTSLAAPTPPMVEMMAVAPERPRRISQTVRMVKLPLQRLRPVINKYLKMLDIHLQRMNQHQCNMDKWTKGNQWTQLHQEQMNAARTAQQIAATLQQLQRTRTQVVDNQVKDFHALLHDFGVTAMVELDAFLCFCQVKRPGADGTRESSSVSVNQDNTVLRQTPSRVLSPPDNSCAAASREQLRQEIEELHGTVMAFVTSFTVTAATEAEETAQNDSSETVSPAPQEEEKTNNKRSKLKMAMLPVVGALLGGVVAGPVGLAAGIKIGALAGSVGGGVAGLASTTILTSQSKSLAKASHPDHNENSTKDGHATIPDSPTTQQQSSMQNDSQPSSLSSLPQTSSSQGGVDNRPKTQWADDSSDDNGNMSMSLWDQIMFWGKGSETE